MRLQKSVRPSVCLDYLFFEFALTDVVMCRKFPVRRPRSLPLLPPFLDIFILFLRVYEHGHAPSEYVF